MKCALMEPINMNMTPRAAFLNNVTGPPNASHTGDEQLTNSSINSDIRLPATQFRVISTFALFIFAAISNLTVLCTISHNHRKTKSHVRILIVNLTTADLLITFIVMPLDAVWHITTQWYAGEFACRLLMFLRLLAMYSSAFITVVISLDRHSAILNPLGIGKAKAKNKTMLSVAWVLSVLLAVPQLFLFHVKSPKGNKNFVQCVTHGNFVEQWHHNLYYMFTFVFLFILPLFIMIFCYCRILLEISKRMREGSISSKEIRLRRSNNNIPKARMRTLKMSIAIVSSFVVCWTPYYVLGIWYWFDRSIVSRKVVPHFVEEMSLTFGLLNACLDPVIYGVFAAHVRREVRRCCRWPRTAAHDRDSSSTPVTGSFRYSASSVRSRRVPFACSEQPEATGAHATPATRLLLHRGCSVAGVPVNRAAVGMAPGGKAFCDASGGGGAGGGGGGGEGCTEKTLMCPESCI
ncbi:gonadotropin-releasing hormone II receptor-like [Lampetra fluviatilis]